MKIDKVVIVGGGSSGWMTAAALAHKFPEIDLTLVESEELGTIGVGESTLGHINRYFQMLGLKDEEWMPACDATYKTSIWFEDFHKKGSTFQYPFGNTSNNRNRNIQDYFDSRALFPDKLQPQDFARIFTLNSHLSEQNRMPSGDIPEHGFYQQNVAYHLDAIKFARYLKERFCKNITHVIDTVEDVTVSPKGVEELHLKSGKRIDADLFIDCSGFASILLEKTLDVEYHEFPTLVTDSAVAARIPYEEGEKESVNNYTNCKAMSSGWMWEIGLWSRKGKGYVYSSMFQDQDSAEEEFREQTGWKGDVRHIKFKHGYHEKAWVKNTVAIGLSYAFIEPLESTGLMTTHENVLELISILSKTGRNIKSIDKTIYNKIVSDLVAGFSGFVALHYGMSRRDDTPFWRYVTEQIDYDIHPDDIVRESNSAREFAYMHSNKYYKPDYDGLVYVAAGMDYNVVDADYIDWLNNTAKIDESVQQFILDELIEIKQERNELVSSLPSHYEYLKKEIYKETENG